MKFKVQSLSQASDVQSEPSSSKGKKEVKIKSGAKLLNAVGSDLHGQFTDRLNINGIVNY